MAQYRGSSRQHEVKASRRRKDTRTFGQKWTAHFNSADGVVISIIMLPIMGFATVFFGLPFGGEIVILLAWLFHRYYIRTDGRHFEFPYRVPIAAKVSDDSMVRGKFGDGICYLGNDDETKEQIYAGNSDLRTHLLVFGTTGSGKTEFLLGLVANALVQNSGCIYCDGKGDPKLQSQVFRLARYFGREDDLSIINFITSGRDFVEKQPDKITNNMNIMGNTSSGMLIELIVGLMDDSGGGGDMWKGRAISFVAALTRPLCYMRDKGYLNLSPEKFLEYFELNEIEELVWNHNGKYGSVFDMVLAPLRSYLVTLPGYNKSKPKKQETKTLEQHGFIVMQLTRIFNDLTFNFGHIFKTNVGDVDFYDVVINRRILTVLLPALERAPDSLSMLGKMIVGSIKQMMAGCLGNRVEGVVREIIDSRPTNAAFPFYCILDEYGYYAVKGFAVAPAQARSLGFSITFAAQDFSSLKKSSPEEADATWENTNIRVVGKMSGGSESETWKRINGAAGQATESAMGGFKREVGTLNDKYYQQDSVNIERRDRLDYDDLNGQADGDFTFIVGKKRNRGASSEIRIMRGQGFYTASPSPKNNRINDFVPVVSPDPSELPKNKAIYDSFRKAFISGDFLEQVRRASKKDPVINGISSVYASMTDDMHAHPRGQTVDTAMGWFFDGQPFLGSLVESEIIDPLMPAPETPEVVENTAAVEPTHATATITQAAEVAPAKPPSPVSTAVSSSALRILSTIEQQLSDKSGIPLDVVSSLEAAADAIVTNQGVGQPLTSYESPLNDVADDSSDDDIELTPSIAAGAVTNIIVTAQDTRQFSEKVLPFLQGIVPKPSLAIQKVDEWQDYKLHVASTEALEAMAHLSSDAPLTVTSSKLIKSETGAMRERIASATTYIDKPTPTKMGVDDLSERIAELAKGCSQALSPLLSAHKKDTDGD